MDKILIYFRNLDELLPPQPSTASPTKQHNLVAEKWNPKEKFPDPDAFSSFLENVFTELDGKEYRMSLHHDGSVLVERILRATDTGMVDVKWNAVDTAFYFRVFVDRLAGKMREMACHRYASHVVQTIIRLCVVHKDAVQGAPVNGLPTIGELVERIRDELWSAAVLCDAWGSHAARDLVNALLVFKLPIEFADPELAFNQNASLVLQHFVAHTGTLPLHQISSNDFIQRAITDRAGSRLLEACLPVLVGTTSASFQSFYAANVRGRVHEQLADPIANHVIRALLLHAHSDKQMGLLLDEMRGFEELAINRVLVLVSLVEWANGRRESRELVARFIFEAFGLKSTEDKKASFLAIMAVPNGPSLLSRMASLTEASQLKHLYDSLLDTDGNILLQWSKDAAMSRVLESYISATTPSRIKLIRKFRHRFAEMATDRLASHVVDKCIASADLSLRKSIMEELAAKLPSLRDNVYGKFVVRNCHLEEFVRNRDEWRLQEGSKESKRKMLESLFESDNNAPVDGKKKRSRNGGHLLSLEECGKSLFLDDSKFQ